MSKERLEEIKQQLEESNSYDDNPNGYWYHNINWLIEQAELLQSFAKKNVELNEFLNKYCEAKHFGKNVIDVAMDIITKQAERVQELENKYKLSEGDLYELIDKHKRTKEQNKRYREKINVALALLESVPFREPEASGAVKHLNKALEGEE